MAGSWINTLLSLPPIVEADYKLHWGRADYGGKTVIDIGAGCGDTSRFFILRGAKSVISVEPRYEMFTRLRDLAAMETKITALFDSISNGEDIRRLIYTYNPDIIKIDWSGCEYHMAFVDDETIMSVPEYIIKTYNTIMFKICWMLFRRLQYNIIHTIDMTYHTNTIYARWDKIV